MRGREYVVSLKPCGRGMVLETLRYTDELNKAASYFRSIGEAKPDPELLDLATTLIDKRSGSFDSRQVPEKLSLEHHELMRPVALWQQTFDLKYSPQHILLDVTGAESAVRRVEELYDDHLRGTEQDLNTRAFERNRLNADSLRAAWAPLFHVPVSDLPPAMSSLQSVTDAEFIACIEEDADGLLRFEKQAPTVSYGLHAEDHLTTVLKRQPNGATEQVLVLTRGDESGLDQVSAWDTLGMRGTCSPGFVVRARFPSDGSGAGFQLVVVGVPLHERRTYPASDGAFVARGVGSGRHRLRIVKPDAASAPIEHAIECDGVHDVTVDVDLR